MLLSSCSLFPPPESRHDDRSVFYYLYEDFSSDELGGRPDGWTINSHARDEEYVQLKVVDGQNTSSGRALHVVAGLDEDNNMANITIDFETVRSDVKKIAIEHKVYWVAGTSMVYLRGPDGSQIAWLFESPGRFSYNAGDNQYFMVPLKEGWNTIRLVADRLNNEVSVFINDMDNSAFQSPLPFIRPMHELDSWGELALRITHWTGGRREVMYGDIKVWKVE